MEEGACKEEKAREGGKKRGRSKKKGKEEKARQGGRSKGRRKKQGKEAKKQILEEVICTQTLHCLQLPWTNSFRPFFNSYSKEAALLEVS